MVAPRLGEQAGEVLGRRLRQVDALEVLPGGLELVAPGVPEGPIVLQEVGQRHAHPGGPGADLARVGLRDRRAVQVGAGHPRQVTPRPGGSGSFSARGLGAPAVAVRRPQGGGQRGEAAGPVEVEEPERVLVTGPERPGSVHPVRRVEVLRPVARVPVTGVLVDRDDVGHVTPSTGSVGCTDRDSGPKVRQATRSALPNAALIGERSGANGEFVRPYCTKVPFVSRRRRWACWSRTMRHTRHVLARLIVLSDPPFAHVIR